MGDVYGNVNVNYSYCKSVAQLKSAADYILGRRKEQVEDGVVKTEPHLYKAFGCNRDNFANSLCEFPYKSRVMGTSEPLKPLKAPYMARNPVKWGFFRLKGQEIPLKI